MRGKWMDRQRILTLMGRRMEAYVQLAEGGEQGVWLQTFVKGLGYKKF
jgi:hypothetical protein